MQVVEKLFQERKSELMFADDVYTVLERQRVHRLYSVNDGFTRTVFKLSIWKLEKKSSIFSVGSYKILPNNVCHRYLVEQREVDLNVRDRWDSTPL